MRILSHLAHFNLLWSRTLLLALIFFASPQAGRASINVVANFVPAPNGLQVEQEAALVQGSDGNFYGTTESGGAYGYGTVFKITPEGVLATLVSFNNTNGSLPETTLTQGPDGNFYGTTYYGGASGLGTAFKITPAGALTTLISFTSAYGHPILGMVQGNDGNFYGTMSPNSQGASAIFRLTPTGVFTALATFASGEVPSVGLVKGLDGNFYGVTNDKQFKMTPGGVLTALPVQVPGGPQIPPLSGGPATSFILASDGNFYGAGHGSGGAGGSIFRMTPSGDLTAFASWNPPYGNPLSLVQGSDGNFYGTTKGNSESPPYSTASYFQVTPAGVVTFLQTYPNVNGDPLGPFILGKDGNFYGNGGRVFRMDMTGATTTLFTFTDLAPATPYGNLLSVSDGSFYGTTYGGGTSKLGTIYKLTPDNQIVTIVSFNGSNGSQPRAGLIQASDGNFYGTTSAGGAAGDGTVFKLTPDGDLTILVSFNGTNGQAPYAALIQGSDGVLYGTTFKGGTSSLGTAFKLTLDGVLTTLVNFNGTDGSDVWAGLVQGTDGNFYGTTNAGGTSEAGTAFELTPAAVLTTLVSFGNTNGYQPAATLIQGVDGYLYGATYETSVSGDSLFKLSTSGVLVPLVSSPAHPNLGHLITGLLQASNGNFYGMSFSNGTVYQVTQAGVLSIVGTFESPYSASPYSVLVEGRGISKDGYLYGTTSRDGSSGFGTIFRVPTLPQSIDFASIPDMTFAGPQTIPLSASSSSGLPVSFSTGFSGPSPISGNILAINGAGTYTVLADQAGDATYAPAPEVARSFTVFKGSQTISSFGVIPGQPYGAAPLTFTAPAASSHLPVTVTVLSGPATLSGNTLTFTGSGVVTLAADQAGDSNYLAAQEVSTSFVVALPTEPPVMTSSPTSMGVLNSPFAFQVAGSNEPTSYVLTGTLPKGLSFNPATGIISGTPTQTGVYALTVKLTNGIGTTNTAVTLTIDAAAADIFVSNFNSHFLGEYTSLGATKNYALAAGLGSPFGVAVSGTTVFVTDAASDTIGAYSTDGTVINTSLVTGLHEAFGIAVSGSTIYVVNGQTGTIGAYSTSGATINASLITGLNSPNYIAVSGSRLFVSSFSEGTIGEYTTDGATVNAALVTGLNEPMGVAVSGSNLYVAEYGAGTIGEYTTNGAMLNAALISGLSYPYGLALLGNNLFVTVGGGPSAIGEYTLTGQTVNASLITAGLNTPTGIAVQGGGIPQTITFPALGDRAFTPAPIPLNATSSSGLPVTYTATGPVKIQGATMTLTGPGQVRIRANQNGDFSHVAAPSVLQGFTVTAAAQTVNFPVLADRGFTTTPFALKAAAASGLPITYTSTGPVKISGGVATLTGVGTVRIRASQAGDANYKAAASVLNTFAVTAGEQKITFPVIADQALGTASFKLSATSSSGLPISYAAFGKATVKGNVVTLTGVGEVRITADQAGNADYQAAATATRRFKVVAAP